MQSPSVGIMSDLRTTNEDDHASETATERAAQLAETAADNEQADAQDKVVTDGGLEVDQTSDQAAAAEGSADGFSAEPPTVEQGGGAVHVAEPTAAKGERVVERLRIRWGCNNSKKIRREVPAQWVIDGPSLAEGGPVTVNVRGGKNWAGTVTEIFYQQNPLDLALPIKRSRHQSPVST